MKRFRILILIGTWLTLQGLAPTPLHARETAPVTYASLSSSQRAMIDDLEQRTFRWFWENANPKNGLIPDHYPGESFSSIASVGFGLTAYGIGAERGYITRAQAVDRTLATLRFFNESAQNDSEDGATGYHGFYYHFLNIRTGKRQDRAIELSSVDTAWLLAGMLFAQSYYDRDTPQEKAIRDLADALYRRVDWTWMQARAPLLSMGWTPGGSFIGFDWRGYDEGILIYVLALGSPTHPVSSDAWDAWTHTYPHSWGNFQGQIFLNFAPLFGHQYSESWLDFRGIRDAWSRQHDLDYFENGRRATLAQRAYAIANPAHWAGYGANLWGLTASNGPGDTLQKADDGSATHARIFYGYTARGAGLDYINDDGTIAPTAAISSIAFAPDVVVPAIETMKTQYGPYIYNRYGFVDAFNPSFRLSDARLRSGSVVPDVGWVDNEQLGIDQGPIELMLENWRSDLVWKVMRKNPYIRKGLERAGFTGGWLDKAN